MAFNIINKLKHLIKEPKLDSNGFMIYAPISGEVIPITDVPDVVFSEKIAGDGVAIKPTSSTIVAPVDGVATHIFETNHLFGSRFRVYFAILSEIMAEM